MYAKLIFPNSISMQLGLFFTGISPGGGASSVWSLLLGGNINLSIVLTTIGTLESFSMYFRKKATNINLSITLEIH